MMKLNFSGILICLFLFFSIFTHKIHAQDKPLKGTVTDVSGTPLIGVNVVEKGTTNGTVTNNNGEFSFIANPNATIIFSYIGFKEQEVTWNGRGNLNVTLHEDTELLDEVVVVGYGVQKKVNLTGSISIVDEESLSNRPLTNSSQALQGLSGIYVNQAGGNPGQDVANISIRGIGSIGGSAKLAPLVLVDGVETSLRDVNPNDIKSISVLKDAASTSIYGSRAANGVILITTKLETSKRSIVNYSGYIGRQTPTYLPDPVDNSATFMEYYNKAMVNQGGVPYYKDELINEFKSNPTSLVHPNTNWMEVLFGSALIHEHNLRFSGGTEKTKYNFSLGYLDQEGVLKGMTSAQKYNANLRVQTDISERFGIDVNMMANRWNVNQPSEGMGTAMNRIMRMVPIQPVGRMENGNWPDSWVLTPGQNSFQNPMVLAEDHYGKESSNRILASLGAYFDVTENLRYNAQGSINYNNVLDKRFAPVTLLHNVKTGKPTRSPWSTTGYKREYNRNDQRLNFTHTLTYSNNFSQYHNITALLGNSVEQFTSSNRQAQKTGYISKDLTEINVGTMEPSASGTSYKDALISYFGRIQYDYKDKYLFEVNSRYDGSSRFAKGNKWGFFPSFSAGWRISEEDFMDSFTWLDELKIRASWGQIGNQEIGRFQYVNAVAFGYGYPFGGTYDGGGVAITQYRDPNIKWETTTMKNIALDWMIFQGKLSGAFEFFHKRTDDILRAVSIPLQVGALNGPTTNIATVDNTGFEFSINHNNTIGDFSYSIGGHLTKIKNKVIDLKGETIYSGSKITKEGYPIDSWYVYETDGLFQTQAELDNHPKITNRVGLGDVKYVDRNGDGVINGDDRYIAGNTFPDITYGFNIGVGYKGFSLTTLWQGVQNIDVWLSGNMILPFNNGAGLIKKWTTDSWTPENPNASLPRITTRHQYTAENFSPSDYWLQDASYLRLKNINLSYQLPKISLLDKIGITNLNIFTNGENLLTLSKMKDFDPEQDVKVENIDKYPSIKTITFGINVTF